MNRTFREIAETVVIAAVIFVVLQASTQTFRVIGPSMQPTLHTGQHLFVNKAVYAAMDSQVLADILPWVHTADTSTSAYLFHGPRRNDVIVFVPPMDSQVDFVKRVIGLPGDKIDIRGGVVYVNGNPRHGDRYTGPGTYFHYPITVPPGHYFVLGDNRPDSSDSRSWGYVRADEIVGKVEVRYWPLSEFHVF